MQQCHSIAKRGIGTVSPNPPVGALIKVDDQILSTGYHNSYGGPHAEIQAIKNALEFQPDLLTRSTLYVSLEPCCHYGKTPPCVNEIIDRGIPKVVFGCYDPHPLVSGKGAEYLRKAGIEVVGPVLEKESLDLIRAFTTNSKEDRPYIILKWAQSSDGFISRLGERTAISQSETAILVHKWRSEADGILIGRTTYDIDQPILNNRFYGGKSPQVFVLSSDPAFNPNEKWTVINSSNSSEFQTKISDLLKQKIGILLVEGGSKTIQLFLDLGLWDEARIITNSKSLQNGLKAPVCTGVLKEKYTLAKDLICVLKRK